jgi:hypothetical protein
MSEPSKEDKEKHIRELQDQLSGYNYALQGMALEGIEIPDELQKEYARISQELDELMRT